MKREIKRAYKERRLVAILVDGVITDEPATYKEFKKAFKRAIVLKNREIIEVRISAF